MNGFVERWLGLLLIVLTSVLLPVQGATQGQVDKDFVVRQLTRAQEEVEDFAANLVQEKRISLLRRDIVSHGMIEFKRPNKVLIELFDPDPSLMVVDGNSLWLYFKRERVAQRYEVENNPMLKRFLMILENPFKGGWEKLASIRKEGDLVVLDVVPEEVEAIFSKITLWVSTQDWLIRKLALYEKSGDLTILSYNNIRVNTGIPDSRFRINLPTDVEILQPAQP
jgi:outer membrane lipoprotein carrier protein